jgi:hypothetical protein
VVRQLRKAGWLNARALVGGWAKWVADGMPVDVKSGIAEQG